MARKATRRASRPGRWPERSFEKHNLEHFERFCYRLKLPDGLGPFRLQDFQLVKLEDYFNGVLENLWLETTGAGKSTLLGAVLLHHGTYVRENPNAFILGGLGNHGRNTLDAAAGFVERSLDLSRWWEAQEYGMGRLKSLIPGDVRGVIKVASAGRRAGGRGGSSVEGSDPTIIGVEENHRHEDNGAAVATLVSKIQKRSAGGLPVQIIHVTTVGDTLDSPLGRLVRRATDISAGCTVETDRRPGEYYRRAIDADGDLVMHEWAVPDHIQPPAAGHTREELDEYLAHVKRACPAPIVTLRSLRLTWKALASEPWIFQRQNCNQWVTTGQPAIDRVAWRDCLVAGVKIPAGRGVRVFVGLDTASKFDSTGIVPVWAPEGGGKPVCAGAVILKSPKDGTRRRLGDVVKVLDAMRERWPDMVLVFDRNAGGGYIADQLEEEHGLTVIDHNQGTEFDLASMKLGEVVAERAFEHDGNPDLTEQVTAAIAKQTASGRLWRIEKPGDGGDIDGADALAMALNEATRRTEPAPAVGFHWLGDDD